MLSLSEKTLKKLVDSHSRAAALFLLNLSKALALKLVRGSLSAGSPSWAARPSGAARGAAPA